VSARRGIGIALLVVLVLALGTLVARPQASIVLAVRAIARVAGYEISLRASELGWQHARLDGLEIRHASEPVLAADHLDVDYSVHAPWNVQITHVAFEHPDWSIIRHPDGSFNLPFINGSTAPEFPTVNFTVHVQGGRIRLLDQAPLDADLSEQDASDIDVDVHRVAQGRSVYHASGIWIAPRTRNAVATRWPWEADGTVDQTHAYVEHHLRARVVPVRGPLQFLVHVPAVRFADGLARAVDVSLFGIASFPSRRFEYHLGGSLDVAGGRLEIAQLAEPIVDLQGRVDFYDDGVTTTGLVGTLADASLRVRGGIYDFADLHFRLAVQGSGSLERVRRAFGGIARQPFTGPVEAQTVLRGRVSDLLVRTALRSERAGYAGIAADRFASTLDIARNALSLSGTSTQYAGVDLRGAAMFDLAAHENPTIGVVQVTGSLERIPVFESLASDARADGALAFAGSLATGMHYGGSLQFAAPTQSGRLAVSFDGSGRGDIGPIVIERADGGRLAGDLAFDRATSLGAGWLIAHDFPIHHRILLDGIPGIPLSLGPDWSGTFNLALAGGVVGSSSLLAGQVHAENVRLAGYQLGRVEGSLVGGVNDLRIADLQVDGPQGRFDGTGASSSGQLALSGRFSGDLRSLAAFTGSVPTHGRADAPIAVLVDPRRVVVQTSGARLHDGRVGGIGVEHASGTITVRGHAIDVIAADATVHGKRAVASTAIGHPSTVAVSVIDLPAAAIRGTGIPLDAGMLSLFGVADLGAPRFTGTIDLRNARAYGYPIAGWADLALIGTSLRISDGVAGLGGNYGRLTGQISAVTSSAPQYQLDARVQNGDVATLVRDFRIPLRYAHGSYRASLHVFGAGADPRVVGSVTVPEGSVHGLTFNDASGNIALSPRALALDGGAATIGSTVVRIDASQRASTVAFSASSDAADLQDFNPFFDASDMLAGRGRFAFDYAHDGTNVRSSGRASLAGARFGGYPVSDVEATWSTSHDKITTNLSLAGQSGRLAAKGTITPGSGNPLMALQRAHYDGHIETQALDLGAWLPATGLTVPILGQLDASEDIAGTWPQLGLAGNVSLANGFIGRYPVKSAVAQTRLEGERITADRIAVDLGTVTVSGSGSLAMTPNLPLDLHLHASANDVAQTLSSLGLRPNVAVSGSLEADARISGTVRAPQLLAGFELDNLRLDELAVPRAVGSFESTLQRVILESLELDFPHGSAVLAGTLPLALRAPYLAPSTSPLSLTLTANGIDLAPFSRFLPGKGTSLSGTLDARVVAEGTIGKPRVLGSGTLKDGGYLSALETSPIRHVDARFGFTGTSIALEALHADVGSGTIDASGALELPLPDAPDSGYAIAVRARGAQVRFPTYGNGQIDGTMEIVSGTRRPTLSGDVTVSHARIPFAALSRAASATNTDEPGTGPLLDLGFALRARAGDDVRIVSPILDVGANGTVNLSGTLREPRLAGSFSATRGGVFSNYQRSFRIQAATVNFDPAAGVVPTIDLRALARVTNPDPDPDRNAIGSATITLVASGPADGLVIKYSSDPAYSQEQILGLLIDAPLFGAVNFGNRYSDPAAFAAPGEFNVLLPPGVTPYQAATTTVGQEAFSLVSTQFSQRLLPPIERFFGGALGLTDLELTVGYGGQLGYVARQEVIPKSNLSVTFGQIVTAPNRTQFGLDMHPDAVTDASFSYYSQAASPSLVVGNQLVNPTTTYYEEGGVVHGIASLANRQGFSLKWTRRYP
jgi:autotransporter translocation and assembly factor TamB